MLSAISGLRTHKRPHTQTFALVCSKPHRRKQYSQTPWGVSARSAAGLVTATQPTRCVSCKLRAFSQLFSYQLLHHCRFQHLEMVSDHSDTNIQPETAFHWDKISTQTERRQNISPVCCSNNWQLIVFHQPEADDSVVQGTRSPCKTKHQ